MDLGVIGNVLDTLLEAGGAACVDLEDLGFGRLFSDAICILDSDLRFAERISNRPSHI